ncbi:hypothetical protein KCV01_g1502, partial [Aureobasidium melanogenum]
MDMTPPQAPPPAQAGTTAAETATLALTHLNDSRHWLLRQPEAMPEWTLPQGEGGIATYLASLASFWQGVDPATGLSRTSALAHHLARIMKDEATLRLADGTLDERARAIIGAFTAARVGALPEALHVEEVTLGEVPYAGAILVSHDHLAELTLLFLPDAGWLAFDNRDGAYAHLKQRFDLTDDPLRSRGLTSDDLAQGLVDGVIGTRAVTADTFDHMARRLIDVQREKISLAWDDYGLDTSSAASAAHLSDRVRDHLRLGDLLDVEAMLDLREARLLDAVQSERLAQVPSNVRNAWHKAHEAYVEALMDTATLRDAVGITEPESIHDQAVRLLSARLKTLGVDTSPDDISIDIIRAPHPDSPADIAGVLTGHPSTRRVTLSELTYEGIGQHQLDSFRAAMPNAAATPSTLTGQAIRDMVRDIDLSTRYQTYLETTFRDGSRGAAAKALALHLQQARMQFEAEEARLGYYLADTPTALIFDREERGYRWIASALDERSTAQRKKVEGHDIDVFQLTYKGAPLTDVLVFGSRTPQSAPRVVMYTPGAPDGISYREFADRQEAARQFFYHPAFREYLLDRLPAEFTRSVGGRREFAGDTRAHWVLGAANHASYTLTEEPFAERRIDGDFIGAAYDASVELRKRNTRLVARSVAEADRDAIIHHPFGQLPLSPGARFAAQMLVEVPASAIRAVQASWRFYDHVRAGDRAAAFIAFAEGYTSALNVVTPGLLSPARRAPSIRSMPGSRSLTPSRLPGPVSTPTFESRYIARSVQKGQAPDAEGFHQIGGRRYIEKDGHLYGVRFDDDYRYWRLTRPDGNLDPNFTGPAIERVHGQWQHARDIGLPGGMRRALRDRFRRVMRVGDDPAAAAPPPAEAPAAPAPAPAEPHFYLPPAAEHLRPELTAAMRDNPRAHLMVRSDGSDFHLRPTARHEILFGEGLSADLAALSVHQRRAFVHELESRFPEAAERATVIDALGLARGGRRVPSPTRAGSAPRGNDGQVPEVSSSSGDEAVVPGGSPVLSRLQRARWDEALVIARETPRVSPRVPSPVASTSARTPNQPLPRDQWPERIWLYMEHAPAFSPNGTIDLAISPMVVRRSALAQNRFRALTLPPETPSQQLDEALGVPLERRNAPGGAWHIWVEIDTRALRNEQIAHGRPAYDIYPSSQDQGGVRYSLRSWFHHLRLPRGSYRMGLRVD